MKNNEDFHPIQNGRVSHQRDAFDPVVILSLILKNWYFFVFTLIIALICAHFYIRHTMPKYRVSTTILINDTGERPIENNVQLLQGMGLSGGMRNLDNQIKILLSRTLTERALQELPYEIEYYYTTLRNRVPIYPDIPIVVKSDSEIPLPMDTEFSVKFQGNNMFILESESEYFALNKSARFGDTIEIQGGNFRIESVNNELLNLYKDRKIYFEILNRTRLINSYNKRINVELLSQEGSILRISITGSNRTKDVDFLNKLIECFQAISLNKKNTEAARRIQFIDDQLIGISDSLLTTENKLQQFRSTHKVMDLSAQGQAIIGQLTILENEKARLELEANYYDYLGGYLLKDIIGESPVVPITMGITDPGLIRLVDELTSLQGQLSTRGAGEMNPLQKNLEQRVRITKSSLIETLNGLRRANSLARSENQKEINKINTQASALPVTERQLLGIERKFKLNDELYTFLLETRAEQEMQKASNMADSEVIDPADISFSSLVSPNLMRTNLIALFTGFFIPFMIIYLNFFFSKKLKYEDIRNFTDIPIVGNIPHNEEKTNTVVFEHPNSGIAESYRLLRSKMQFLIKDTKTPVILITSSLSEDGKTFTAINLASVYSLLGKKTILVGFDLRKPQIFQDFNLNNEKGVSTWLIGKDLIHDIIQETSFDNLSIISSGPIPPNPSELIVMDKTKILLELLKEKYDYIIIDSSPIGIVSDTIHLTSLADTCLFVVRPLKTIKDMYETTLNEISNLGINGFAIVINDIKKGNKQYGYGEKYGYVKDQKKTKKKLI